MCRCSFAIADDACVVAYVDVVDLATNVVDIAYVVVVVTNDAAVVVADPTVVAVVCDVDVDVVAASDAR
jgi:hypothetical protein